MPATGPRYDLRRELSSSPRASVWLVWDRELNREVVIKRASVRGPDDESMLNEGRLLSEFHHPGVVECLGFGRDEKGAYLVMEWVAGQPLDRFIESEGVLDFANFKIIVTQMLEALAAVHDKRIVHFDIKPENILISRAADGPWQVKLLDFGIARLVTGGLAAPVGDRVMGSLFYMAPERFDRGEGVDLQSDVYSAGCVSYFMLTGRPPFCGDTAPQVMVAHLRHLVKPLRALRSDVPEEIARWVLRSISRSPEDRPANAREALLTFREAIAACR